jgi:hypothetical protein
MTGKLRCMTCQKDYDAGSPLIHAPLQHFEEWCICRECVDVAAKRVDPKKSAKD